MKPIRHLVLFCILLLLADLTVSLLQGCERQRPAPAIQQPAIPVPDVPRVGPLTDLTVYKLPDGVICYQRHWTSYTVSCLQVRP